MGSNKSTVFRCFLELCIKLFRRTQFCKCIFLSLGTSGLDDLRHSLLLCSKIDFFNIKIMKQNKTIFYIKFQTNSNNDLQLEFKLSFYMNFLPRDLILLLFLLEIKISLIIIDSLLHRYL